MSLSTSDSAPAWRRSIKIRVFWIISFFGCILTVAFATIAAMVVLRTTTAQAEQALNLETSQTNVRMDEYFRKAFQVLELGADLPALNEMTARMAANGPDSAHAASDTAEAASPSRPSEHARAELATELEQLRATFDFLYMYYGLEADGSLVVYDYDEPEGFDTRVRPWYELARESGELSVTEPYLDAATDVWVASVSRPVRHTPDDSDHTGELAGVLGIDVSLEAIAGMVFSGSKHFPTLRNLIVSDQGEVLIAAEEQLLGKPFPLDDIPFAGSAVSLSSNGSAEATRADGEAGSASPAGSASRSAGSAPATGSVAASPADASPSSALRSAGSSIPGLSDLRAAVGSIGRGGSTEMSRIVFDGDEQLAFAQLNESTDFVLVSIIDPAEISAPAVRMLLLVLGLIAAVLALYIFVMNRIVARMITMPIMEIAEDMGRIESLELDGSIEPASRTYEIHLMQAGIEMMKRSLRSFRRYVPSDVVSLLVKRHAEATLGAEKRELSLFFSDIAGFTTLSESLDPDTLAEYLGHYFEGVTAVLQNHRGTVDKFIGDAIMAFWGAPLDVPNHAQLACRAALECQEFLERARADGLLPGFHTRIGINTGEAVVGNMGYAERMSYTAIGDSVNVASRFEGLNKYYGTGIVTTDSTRGQAGDEFLFRKLDTVVVKGKHTGHTVYELLGFRERMTAEQLDYYERFTQAVDAYDARDWKRTATLLRSIRTPDRRDKPLEILLKRALRFLKEPPPKHWKGEVYLREK